MKMKVGAALDINGVRHTITAVSATTVALTESESGFTKEILMSDLVRLPDVQRPRFQPLYGDQQGRIYRAQEDSPRLAEGTARAQYLE